jgi:hypothetical protein
MGASEHEIWLWDRDEEPGPDAMKLRLTYEGELKSGQDESISRLVHKHEIRKQLHPQLKDFWRIHPGLAHIARVKDPLSSKLYIETIADAYTRGSGHRFVPLAQKDMNLMCKIEVLLLRRPAEGGGVYSKGDLDNRIKTLIDALQVPFDSKGIPEDGPSNDERPYFYALFDDDKIISHLSIETDYLLGEVTKKDLNGAQIPRSELDVRAVLTVTLNHTLQ